MARITQILTSNQTWTVPSRAYLLEVFVVGGGGGGGAGGSSGGGGGGAGGNIRLVKDIQVTPGQNIAVTIGGGGSPGANGGTTSFGSISAAGGGAGGANNGTGGATSRNILGTVVNLGGAAGGGGGAGTGASATNKNGAVGFTYNNVLYAAGGGGGINTFNENTTRPIIPGTGGRRGGGDGGGEADAGNDGENTIGSGGGGGAASGTATSRLDPPVQNPNPTVGFVPVAATGGGFGGSGVVIVSYDEAEFDLISNKAGIAEGEAITVTLRTRHVWNGATVPYTITGTGITQDDFTPPSLTGSFTITSSDGGASGSGNVVLTAASDAFTEDSIEQATLSLNNGFALTSFLVGDVSRNALANIESKIISTADYNTIQGKVALVLNQSTTTNPTYGWGIFPRSSQVNESTRVGVTEWNNLRNDIINAWVHLYNTTPTLTSAVENTLVRGNISNAPYAQYDAFANVIAANRFGSHPSQSFTTNFFTETAWPGTFGSTWNTRVFSIIRVDWTNSRDARQFFNSGGEFRFTTTRTGGAATSQNAAWSNLLNSSGTQAFGGAKPLLGTGALDAKNFYRLNNAFTPWYEGTASSPYASNTYRISARAIGVNNNSGGTAQSLEFQIELIDNYAGLGGAPDQVDGTVSISLIVSQAIGTLVPAGTGNFEVVAPTVTVSVPPRP